MLKLFAGGLASLLVFSVANADVNATRALGSDASFSDLVSTARRLVQARQGGSKAGCLLRADEAGIRLEAALDPGLPELADPPRDLDAIMRGPVDVSFISRLGRTGGEKSALTLVALTPVARAVQRWGMLPVLVQTDEGLWFTVIARPGRFRAPAQLLDERGKARLLSDLLPQAPTMVVTAEADVPLASLVETLRLLKHSGGSVVLAVAEDAVPKVRDVPTISGYPKPEDACPVGMSALPKGAKEASLTKDERTAMLDMIKRVVQETCAPRNPDAGGNVMVQMRVTSSERVGEACIDEDLTQDKAIRACVLKTVKRTPFPKLTNGTFMNFWTEFAITPRGLRQSALCEP